MRDPYLTIIAALIHTPLKPLKYYLEVSKVSRGTFFKVKADLEAKGIIFKGEGRQILLDHDRGVRFLADAYPGVLIDFPANPHRAEAALPTWPSTLGEE